MSDTLTEPAPAHTHDTEPLPVVRAGSPEKCGVDGCGKAATPLVYCQDCKRPLCAKHIEVDVVGGVGRVTCPEHKGGE